MKHGEFVWYDLVTTDLAAAEAFYKSVVGWEASDSGLPGAKYMILSIGDKPIGGMMAIPAEAGQMPPAWNAHVAVDDVDAAAAKAASLGGKVLRGPENIPEVGRFAVIADPHGAVIMIFKGSMENPPPKPEPMSPGSFGWHELMAGDLDSAWEFYASMFGWTKDEPFDMGEMGIYQLFSVGGQQVGGMMTKPADMPAPPFWLYYINVEAIDAAVQRVAAAGGRVVLEPMEVPGGSWIVQCLDPQGAMFAMAATKR